MPPARIVLWVTSLGGIALLARTLLFDPPPLWLAVSALVGYVTLATAGVLVPQLEMYGDMLWRGAPGARAVALTFDDGPHPETTRKVLAILRGHGDKRATFFVVGRKARQHPEVVREIHAAGHAIGLHGDVHDRLYAFKSPEYVEADIQRTQQAVEDACGVRPTLFRPPVGYVSSRTAVAARRAGVTLVGWSARGIDGFAGTTADSVVRRVAPDLKDGAIVLLHDAAERDDFEPATLRALPRILELIDERGLSAVTVDEVAHFVVTPSSRRSPA